MEIFSADEAIIVGAKVTKGIRAMIGGLGIDVDGGGCGGEGGGR